MIRSIYTSISGLISLENKQSNITNNIANANTTGYKKDNFNVKSFDEVYISNKDKIKNGENVKNTIGSFSLGSEIDSVETYFSQGLLKDTDKKTDFGIDGRGFFVVNKENKNGNQILYTRDGNFTIGIDGTLQTSDGGKVMGINIETGELESIKVDKNDITLSNGNIINSGGNAKYVLATADFLDYNSLEKVGTNYYKADNPILNSKIDVKQSCLENSNISLVNETTDMITTMRNFETNQKLVQMLDETLGKAASEIGALN